MEKVSDKMELDIKIIRENTTEIFQPPGKNVFYNPVQEFNRDLSVLLLQVFSKKFQEQNKEEPDKEQRKSLRILEALSATGLRSIRYAKEVPNVSKIISNDFSDLAVLNMEKNIKHNNVENIVQTSRENAVTLMYNSIHPSQRFDVVDIDPYGSPVQFLDSAVQCVSDGGLLMVTCTDMATLCGVYPETCYVKYGAVSLRSQAMHEMAIRILLQNIQSHASRYKRYIVPVLSLSADFYIRVFIKIYTGALVCKEVISKTSMVYECVGCGSRYLQPLGLKKKKNGGKGVHYTPPQAPPVGIECSHCGHKFHMGGPIWNAPIHDHKFISEMLTSETINDFGTAKRIIGVLTLIHEELFDVPLYYTVPKLSTVFKIRQIPMMELRSAIINGGYRVSFAHAAKESVKTDAPMTFIWDALRVWAEKKSVNLKKNPPGSPGDNILKTPVQHDIDFSLRPDANPLSKELNLTRFQVNPLPNWGPGSRSTTMELLENPKRAENQGKKVLGKRKEPNSDYSKNKEPKLEDMSEYST